MKKYASYILILIILVGLFSPMADTRAQSLDLKKGEIHAAAEITDTSSDLSLGCTSLVSISIPACIAQVAYAIWWVSSLFFIGAAYFLDFFIYYATNSSSYDNTFVEQAWAAVRDIANIFFILALLYVAIKTILGLNVTDNKKLIGAVIIVALIINFSLFTTKIVIDGSNILAKVFYNNIIPVDSNGVPLEGAKAGGQKSISIGIVDKFNPQKLVTQENYDNSKYTFIFMTLLLVAIALYATYIFFSVALLFVARVVSLWISMIFSPIAFASYTVPFDIPGFGHKEWWSELTKNALLAPIFIFFLYIIILFTDFLGEIINYADSPDLSTTSNLMQRIMSVTIPFIIIAILLKKAKELAVKYSGEIGAGINKIGAMAGGLALGATTGGLAMAGRVTIGKYAAGLAGGKGLKNWADQSKVGMGVFRAVKGVASSSFDARNIKVGGGLAATGLTGLTSVPGLKPKEGGYIKARAEKVEKRQKRAKELEVGEDETLKQNLNNMEKDLQDLLREHSHEIEMLDKQIKTTRENASDLASKARLDPTGAAIDPVTGAATNNKDAAISAANKLADLKRQKKDIKDRRVTGIAGGRSINDLEDIEIPHAHAEIEKENRNRKWNYADRIADKGKANREAAHKIRMEEKLDSGDKGH